MTKRNQYDCLDAMCGADDCGHCQPQRHVSDEDPLDEAWCEGSCNPSCPVCDADADFDAIPEDDAAGDAACDLADELFCTLPPKT